MNELDALFFPLRLSLQIQEAYVRLFMQNANEFRARYAALPDPVTAYCTRLSARDEC